MEGRFELPLFPIGAVLFTGGKMPLRIFEPRYIDMIGDCMKSDTGFGIVLIRSGSDSIRVKEDRLPTIFEIGTYATIVDFNSFADGRLGIVVEGGPQIRIHDSWEQENRLQMGSIEVLADEHRTQIGGENESLVYLLKQLIKDPMLKGLEGDIDFGDARVVGWKLAELLPIAEETKQSLLQIRYARERLAELRRILAKFQGRQS